MPGKSDLTTEKKKERKKISALHRQHAKTM